MQQAMAALRTDRTSFVIAHRLSTIRDADLILVMEAGRDRRAGHARRAAGRGRRLPPALQQPVQRSGRQRGGRRHRPARRGRCADPSQLRPRRQAGCFHGRNRGIQPRTFRRYSRYSSPYCALQRRLLVAAHEQQRPRAARRPRRAGSPPLPNSSACPRMIDSTARYIGLRTYRYGPTTTRWAVGIGVRGRAVRTREADERVQQHHDTAQDDEDRDDPDRREPATPPRDPPAGDHRGISPATTPGASTRNTIVPTHARTRTRSM